ncbi:MAG TPA: hypothetical protein VF152_01245 [Acidimicrobiia bacterium]
MPERLLRIVLVLLAAQGAVVGLWATFAPRSFYDDFPGGGRTWVAADGPFNEHLVRDVGSLYLAITVITVAAAILLVRSLVVIAGLGWLVQAVPHLVYHLRHLELYDPGDQVANVTGLVLVAVLAAVALVLGAKMPASLTPRSSASSTSG